MGRVNETESFDNVAAKGLEKPTKRIGKCDGIAVETWRELEEHYRERDRERERERQRERMGIFGTNGSGTDQLTKDGLSEDRSALTFDSPYRNEQSDISSSGKPDATLEGGLVYAPEKPKIPNNGGYKEGACFRSNDQMKSKIFDTRN